jgi:hypothetical protein
MSLDQFAALLQQLREMSDAELTQALANCTKNLRNLEPFTPDYNTCRHVVETVKSHVEMRKAQAGRTDSDWGWLLSSILGSSEGLPGKKPARGSGAVRKGQAQRRHDFRCRLFHSKDLMLFRPLPVAGRFRGTAGALPALFCSGPVRPVPHPLAPR